MDSYSKRDSNRLLATLLAVAVVFFLYQLAVSLTAPDASSDEQHAVASISNFTESP